MTHKHTWQAIRIDSQIAPTTNNNLDNEGLITSVNYKEKRIITFVCLCGAVKEVEEK